MKKIDYDFLAKLKLPGQLEASPARTHLAFVISEASFEDNNYKSNLWLYQEGDIKQLTFDGKVKSFVWEDEQHVLFQACRTKEEKEAAEQGLVSTSYYRLNIQGGEAAPAFKLPLGVSGLEPLGQGYYLIHASFDRDLPNAYVLPEEKRKQLAKEKKDGAYVTHLREIPFYANGSDYTDGDRQGLFLYYAPQGQIERISSEELTVHSYRLSEDKRRLYFQASTFANRMELTEGLFMANLPVAAPLTADAAIPVIKVEELIPETAYSFFDFWECDPSQGPNSGLLVIASDMREYGLNESGKLYRLDREQHSLTLLHEESFECYSSLNTDVDYSAGPGSLVQNGIYYYAATERDHDAIFRITADGTREKLYEMDSILALQSYGMGFVVWALQDMLPAELYYVSDNLESTNHKVLSQFNSPLFQEYQLIKPRRLQSGEEPEIDGWVLYPADFETGKSYPGILDIHGGPRTAYGPVFFHEMQLWAQQGYFVMFCNPRGSSGRGDAFADIRGKYGAIDYDDLMQFLDTCLEKIPELDHHRLGVTGGSYGGFMCNWIIGHTDRFRACATQRSISNWISFYGSSDIGYFFAGDQNATTTDDQAGFLKLWEFSPLRYINSAKTPTLVIHSDKDYRCPLEQGYQIFTALKDRGVDSEMLLFHDETHELSRSGKPKGRRRRLEGISDWMARYLIAPQPRE
ncbi:MAG: S9 family peptidase [Eubacteriales bacterium]|nr:S9 family peptidase [Eubacteriales bacterium]